MPYNAPHIVTARNEVSLQLSVAVRPRGRSVEAAKNLDPLGVVATVS
jgi:hypothetical protein